MQRSFELIPSPSYIFCFESFLGVPLISISPISVTMAKIYIRDTKRDSHPPSPASFETDNNIEWMLRPLDLRQGQETAKTRPVSLPPFRGSNPGALGVELRGEAWLDQVGHSAPGSGVGNDLRVMGFLCLGTEARRVPCCCWISGSGVLS